MAKPPVITAILCVRDNPARHRIVDIASCGLRVGILVLEHL